MGVFKLITEYAVRGICISSNCIPDPPMYSSIPSADSHTSDCIYDVFPRHLAIWLQ